MGKGPCDRVTRDFSALCLLPSRTSVAFLMSSWLVDSDDELPAGLSFLERARAAPEDDDDVPMTDARELDLGDDGGEETQLQRLIRHWTNERHAPDVLPGQEDLLGGLLDHIRRQVRSAACLATRCVDGVRSPVDHAHE